jgi:membrane-bound metal-dependent hydrolase YbcI (DUF457 family)
MIRRGENAMTPIGHLAVGFAAKRAVPRVSLVVLLIASWLPDILFFVFAFAGLERENDPAPWSHGLLMSVMWSSLVGLIALGISLDRRIGTTLGLVVFSHWVLDFISWNNLPLLLPGSRTVGLGLINRIGGSVIFVELALFVPAIASYIAFIWKNRRSKRSTVGADEHAIPDGREDDAMPIQTGEGSENHA